MGEWFLITNQIEQDLISFQAGPEAMLLNPGDIINISDSLKLTNRFGGRVISVNDNSEIILDSLYDFIKVGDSISFIIPRKSVSVNELNELSKTQDTISDSQIDNLSTTYVYTFIVSSIGQDGNFRTKITVATDTVEKQNNFYTISPSSLWIYEKSTVNASSTFNQKYRILGIKENNPVEYEISAVEYVKDKFTYVDNRDNLSANTIYSNDSANQNVTIPRDIISFKSVPASVIMGDNGIVSEDPQPYVYTEKYDYILHGIDYTDSQINNLFSVNVISVAKILDFINSDYASIKDAVKGLLIEYVLNSKKVTFIWHNGDQTVYKIAVPKIEEQNTLEFIRVYPLGVNDSFI
jgi:predicted phage tail protein